jgi:glycosyltransferase involved in cell wall biosynthesis
MKISFISTMQGFSWGGSEELWSTIADDALSRNHSIQICTYEWDKLPFKIIGLRNNGAKLAIRKRQQHNFIEKIRRVLRFSNNGYLKLIGQFNPDVIIVSQGATFDFFAHNEIYQLVMDLKKPYFLISQFNVDHGSLQNQIIRNRIINPKKKWNKFYFVSQRNLLSANIQIAHKLKNTAIVSNPVNIKNITPCEWPKGQKLQIACVARYDCNYKGQDILLTALSAFKDFNFIINFYGSGPDELALNELIKFNQLENKAYVNKHVSNIDEIWENHHLLVLPSIAEGTPLSLQEAMLKGRPALVTDVGGNDTLIIDGETGFLAECASVLSLTKKLKQLFNTSFDDLKAMGEKASVKAKSVICLNSAENILKDIENV